MPSGLCGMAARLLGAAVTRRCDSALAEPGSRVRPRVCGGPDGWRPERTGDVMGAVRGLVPYVGMAFALGCWAPLIGGLAAEYRAGGDLLAMLWPLWVGCAAGALGALLPLGLRACGMSRGGLAAGKAPVLGGVVASLVAGLFGLVLLVASVNMEGATNAVLRLLAGAGLGFGSSLLGLLWVGRLGGGRGVGALWDGATDVPAGPLGWALMAGLACLILTAASWLGYSMAVPIAAALLLLASTVLYEVVPGRRGISDGVVPTGCGGDAGTEAGTGAYTGAGAGARACADAGTRVCAGGTGLEARGGAETSAGAEGDFAAGVGLRPLLSGALLGLAVAFMMGQFLGAEFGSPSEHTWAWGLLGVAVAAAVQLVLRRVLGRWEPFFASWAVAVALLVAFFPIEAGSELSLKFAVAGATLAIWCAAAVLPAVIDAYAHAYGCAPAGCHAALAVGLVLGAAIGGPAGRLVAATELQGIVVYISAIASMVVSFLVLILVLGRPHGTDVTGPGACEGIGSAAGFAGDFGAPGGVDGHASASDNVWGASAPGESSPTFDIAVRCRELAVAHSLTPREAEVFDILARGYDLNRVQTDLGISEGTALTHKRHIYQKLDVHTRADLLDLVRRQ